MGNEVYMYIVKRSVAHSPLEIKFENQPLLEQEWNLYNLNNHDYGTWDNERIWVAREELNLSLTT